MEMCNWLSEVERVALRERPRAYRAVKFGLLGYGASVDRYSVLGGDDEPCLAEGAIHKLAVLTRVLPLVVAFSYASWSRGKGVSSGWILTNLGAASFQPSLRVPSRSPPHRAL
ncbi:hypothetical protein RJT34_06890 [Clitoria ternatea]|uniref:Uncharacterized protein n=1 Tax=Clitoria ternatea TaxID=43366 RepID=A0AAN9K3V3_CLITE